MKLEFHQLYRRYEHLRARSPERQRRLLVSLAASGQQTPIIVVAVSDRYLVIDGYKRVAALEHAGSSTVGGVWNSAHHYSPHPNPGSPRIPHPGLSRRVRTLDPVTPAAFRRR